MDQEALKRLGFVTDGQTECPHCTYFHKGVCPRIRVIEVKDEATSLRVEYHDQAMVVPEVSRVAKP